MANRDEPAMDLGNTMHLIDKHCQVIIVYYETLFDIALGHILDWGTTMLPLHLISTSTLSLPPQDSFILISYPPQAPRKRSLLYPACQTGPIYTDN